MVNFKLSDNMSDMWQSHRRSLLTFVLKSNPCCPLMSNLSPAPVLDSEPTLHCLMLTVGAGFVHVQYGSRDQSTCFVDSVALESGEE